MSARKEINKQLYDAVKRNEVETVTCLVRRGADVNARGGTLEMVELLLRSGSDVNKTNDWGKTALMWAAIIGNENIFDLLIEHHSDVLKKSKSGVTAIHYAAWNNHVTIIQKLLSLGVAVDINDNDGCTPLWLATHGGHVSCVEFLLNHGASPHHQSQNGSPLDVAKQRGHIDVAQMMEEAIRSNDDEVRVCDVYHKEQMISQLKQQNEKLKQQLRQSVHASEIILMRREMEKKEKEIEGLMSALATASRIANERIQQSNAAAGHDASLSQVSLLASQLRQTARLGQRGGFFRSFSDVPVFVLHEVSQLAAQRPSALGDYLGVTEVDLSTMPTTDIPSEKVRNMIVCWINKQGEDATLDKLLQVMQFIGLLGALKSRLAQTVEDVL
ncbi:ankyrin-3-like isoform X3 [Corticium candelabrum]|uniref:ankyrin-3-like isoform X3 n=1 Tax=Corticium candelabrum TaxID=121492 RepID=UPI002E257ED5|nr:ankyrin-3-like isoform X3 [Corticium candelabrum]